MSDLTKLTLAGARDALKAKEITSVELTTAYLEAMDQAQVLNAYVLPTADKALEMAKVSDAKLAKGEGGPLEGLPLGVKDLFATEGVRTTACSHILDNFIPPYESTVTSNLWRDGAVMLGKLNNDEFAMGSSNETSFFGPVINPWRRHGDDAKLVPGGSSGGSSAAVAAKICLAATATDTGGSIRQPASFTGTVGIKPTYGRCSRWGVVAFASSLDQAGPITRDVRDAAIMLGSMAGYDEKDSTSVDKPVPDYEAVLGRGVKGLRVGIPKEYRVDGMPAEIDALWTRGIEWLKAAGAEIVDVSLPTTKYALPTYYIVAPAEASSNLARYDGVRYCFQLGFVFLRLEPRVLLFGNLTFDIVQRPVQLLQRRIKVVVDALPFLAEFDRLLLPVINSLQESLNVFVLKIADRLLEVVAVFSFFGLEFLIDIEIGLVDSASGHLHQLPRI